MNNTNTKENLVIALESINDIEIVNKDEFLNDEINFTRNLEIYMPITGACYTIVWFHNLSNINSDLISIPFNEITLNRPTYPTSNKKLVLQLNKDGSCMGIVG